jgi:hypothetical protein
MLYIARRQVVNSVRCYPSHSVVEEAPDGPAGQRIRRPSAD